MKTATFLGAFVLSAFCASAALLDAADANQIRQLTVDEARRLAQDQSGRLLLNGLVALAPDVAKELAKQEGWLSLNGLTVISEEAAKELGQHKGFLHLDGLKALSDEVAAALAGHRGELALNDLPSLSDKSAEELARHSGGRLLLKGLTTLSPVAARAFLKRKGGSPSSQLHFDGLTTLAPEAAAALVEMHGHNWNGRLPAFKTVPNEVARALAKEGGALRAMPGLTTISSEAAKALVPRIGGELPELQSLTPEVAKVLAQARGHLVLNGLTSLSDESAQALTEKAQNRGNLYLNGLTEITPATARLICQREGDLYLNGLKTIPVEVLQALAEHKSPGYARPIVYLDGLSSLSDEAAAVLATWEKWSGELPALTGLSDKSAAALAASRKFKGSLPAVKLLSAQSARALAQRKGNLSLDGLAALSDDVAQALADHQGGTLSLNGVTSLSDRATAALAQHQGRLSLGGLTSLTAGQAQTLARYKGDWLLLDGLTTLSDEAAQAIAQRKGVLSIVGLKTLSEEGAHALRANPLIVLPSVGKVARVDRTQLTAGAARPAVNLAANEKLVRSFLAAHCADCHDNGEKEGDFELKRLASDDIAGRVAYASIFERLRAGDMPPPSEPRPQAAEVARVTDWIAAKLDSPLPTQPAWYPVKEKPIDGNRLPNAILFGGPRGPSVPPPPRLWRLSPEAYSSWAASAFNAHGLQQPFGLIQEAGFRDFAALYSPDEGATGLLLTNAELIVASQVRGYQLVNVNEKPELLKEPLWPNEARQKTGADAEREKLKMGLRVKGNGGLAALLHPEIRANEDELKRAIGEQYKTVLARPPSDAELASLLKLYEDVARDGDCAIAGKTILMAPMMTPEAILRFEVGLGAEVRPGVRMLSPRETAVALSLALSRKRDLSLLTAAAEGKLTTREEVAAAVRRILNEPKIEKSRVLGFFREYFDYYRAPEVFKDPLPDYLSRRGIGYSPRGFVDETDVLVLSVLSLDRDVLQQLLTTTTSYRTHELFGPAASLDGLRDGHGPLFRSFSPVALEHGAESKESIGVLMQPSWLAAWSTNFHNDIVRRGRWVRERLLGGRVPDLPINVAAMVPDDPHHTLRERQMVTRAGECWKCHKKMDELGLPFENVNHYGYPRSAEEVLDLKAVEQSGNKDAKIYRDAPLDTTGLIAFSGDPALDGPVRDAPELLRRLAESDRVRQVFIRHVFRYFLGRNEMPGDAVSLQEAEKAYLKNGGSFKALLVSLLSSESFLYRTVPSNTKVSK
jgi:mono/diheme cytochrome c family protein